MKAANEFSLRGELKQGKPFSSLQQEGYLGVLRCASTLSHAVDQCLKPYGITQPQYNVLRILQGAGPGGLGRNEIRTRMVHVLPDMSRMLERMERSGWIVRRRSSEDRRHVPTTLTAEGQRILDGIRHPLEDLHQTQFSGMTDAELGSFLRLLETAQQMIDE